MIQLEAKKHAMSCSWKIKLNFSINLFLSLSLSFFSGRRVFNLLGTNTNYTSIKIVKSLQDKCNNRLNTDH